ncbi:hypothetical protein RZS08_49150, partial [Arthrospira platensis SPKY1]|nr:hypothetical protein [Arthrospira platensis SPKY1]
AGVGSGGVSGEQRLLFRGQGVQDLAGAIAEAVEAIVSIQVQRGGAEQFRQFAGRHAPQQVHLEKSLLRMNEPGGAGDVQPGCTLDCGDAQRIALDDDRRA